MALDFGRAVIKISGDISELKDSLAQAKYFSKKAGETIANGFGIAAAGGVAAFTGALTAAVYSSTQLGDEIAKTSQKMGIATKTLSEYRLAAKLADLDIGSLAGSAKYVSKAIVEAQAGNKTAIDTMRRAFGEGWKGIRTYDDALNALAERFASMPDGVEKTALAVEMLGRFGAAMIPMLNGGAKALEEARTRARDYGLVIGPEFAKQSEQFNDNFTIMSEAVQGVAVDIGKTLVPELVKLQDKLIAFWDENAPVIRGSLHAAWLSVANGITAVGKAFDNSQPATVGFFQVLSAGMSGAVALAEALVTGIAKTVEIFTWLTRQQMGGRAGLSALGKLLGVEGLEKVDEQLYEVEKAATAMRQSMAEAAVQSLFLAEAALAGGQNLQYFDESEGKVTSSSGALGDAMADVGKQSEMTGRQIWEAWATMLNFTNALNPAMLAVSANMLTEYGASWMTVAGAIEKAGSVSQSFGMKPVGDLGPGLAPETSPYSVSPTFGMGDAGMLGQFPMIDQILKDAIARASEIDTMPLRDKLEEIAAQLTIGGAKVSEISGMIGDSITGFFGDAVTQGFSAAGKKLLAAMMGMIGKELAMLGGRFIFWGLAEIVAAMSPFTKWMGASAAHGAKMMAVGAALSAAGGAMSGLSSVVGGTAGGSGTSFQSEISRPYGSTVQGMTMDVSGQSAAGATTVYINAVDAKTFDQYMSNGGAAIVAKHVGRSVRGNSGLRRELSNGLSY